MSNKSLTGDTDIIIEMLIQCYPYLRYAFPILTFLFFYWIFTKLLRSIHKLKQTDGLKFFLFLCKMIIENWKKRKMQNQGYHDGWRRTFERYNRWYQISELKLMKTEIIENRFNYLDYCKERKFKMIDISHTRPAMIELDNLNQGLLHSIVHHYDQWSQYIPSLAASTELLAPFMFNFNLIKIAPNWQEICIANNALNKKLQKMTEEKYLEIKLALFRAQLELFEFVFENTVPDHYVGTDDYNDYQYQVQHSTLGRQIMIVSHLQSAFKGPDEERIQKVFIVEKENKSSSTSSVSNTKLKKSFETPTNSGQQKTVYCSKKS